MKIHSVRFRKNIKLPKRSLTAYNPLTLNESKNQNSKNGLNIVKINYDIIRAYRDKQNNIINPKNSKYNNKNKKENKNYSKIVPQKILKFDKNLLVKKKYNNDTNINLYQNALIDKLQLIITNSNNPTKNKKKKNFNYADVQINTIEQKQNSLFNNYRDYQNEFFSSVYDLNYPKQKHDKNNNSSSISPRVNKINNVITKINKNRFSYNNSYNNLFTRPVSNILQRRNHGDLPIFLNSPLTFMKNYKSNSEKERDEKNCNALLRLRDFLDIYWDRRIELVTEFFSIYKINGSEYYKSKSLENFAHYVYDNINEDTNITKGIVETRIPMKEIIDKGIKYNNYSLKKLNYSKSMSKICEIKSKTNNNWLIPSQVNYKKRPINNLTNVNIQKSSTINKNINRTNSCFYNDNYNNNDYQLSDREKIKKKILNEKIEKYRKFLDKNYGVKVNYKFMRKYNQKEIKNYFNKRKVGTIVIPDKDSLINNLDKQSNFYKLKSTSFSIRKNPSIHTFSEKDFNELYNELKETKENYINFGSDIKKNEENKIWIKMYEDVKRNKFEKHPDLVLKKKKKLLEYIIFKNIKERKEFEKELLKESK